jgi:hypothetical protein
MKIRLVGDEFFHADGRTDMTKLIVAFPNLAKAPTNNAKITTPFWEQSMKQIRNFTHDITTSINKPFRCPLKEILSKIFGST